MEFNEIRDSKAGCGTLILGSVCLFFIIGIIGTCNEDGKKETQDAKQETQNTNQTNITNMAVNENSIYSLAYNKNLLETYPFNIKFGNKAGKADDTTYFLLGSSPDGILEATIHYNPIDMQFYFIDFQQKILSLHPSKFDVQPLVAFADKFDVGFSNYFDRNFKGIIITGDKNSIDAEKYMNKEKGFYFFTDCSVPDDNEMLKKYPQEREQILETAPFASITVVNIKKPSYMSQDIDTLKIVEK
jgi:hypothetical protein